MAMRIGIAPFDALLAVVAALLGAAAFPPLGLWPLALVSVVFFLQILRNKPTPEARAIGLMYGMVYGACTMYWLFGLFGPYAITFVALMSGYFGVLATLIGMTRHMGGFARAGLAALFLVAIEWLRGDAWYLRFPWYTAPHALAQSPAWIALGRWVGVYGLSFVVWWIAGLGVFLRPAWWLGFGVLPAASLLLPGLDLPDQRALLIQVEETKPVSQVIEEIPYANVNLAVLPEYAYPGGIDLALAKSNCPKSLAKRLNCPVIFGSVEGRYGEPNFQNVAAVLDANGELLGTFPKQRPVPLMVDGKPGNRRPVFEAAGGVLGIGLCYDFDAPAIAGSLVSSGATVLLAPTGDLMAWGRMQHVHHELLVRIRAVENDRWVLRATSSGRTEAVNPHGIPSEEHLDIGEVGHVEVGYSHRTTFSLGSHAHVLGPTAAALTLLFVLFTCSRRLRSSLSKP